MIEPYFEDLKPSEGVLLYPFSCFISDNTNKVLDIPPHWHYFIEMHYFISGSAKIFLNGDCYNVSEGDFILINSREVHSINVKIMDQAKYIVVKFDPEVLYSTAKTVFEAKYIFPFTMAKSSHQKVFFSEEISDSPVPLYMKQIFEENSKQDYGFELAIRTSICGLFLWLLRNWHNKGLDLDMKSLSKEIDIDKLQILFDYIDRNYFEDITAEEMAKMCNMSYSYFSRQFKKVTRRTFKEYLNYVRVTEAEKILLSTDNNITQIALDTGFSNSSYFIKQFKHYKNISPKQFRKKIIND